MLTLLVCLSASASGAAPVSASPYTLDSWTAEGPLPGNWTLGIRQTPDGYLWLTSRGGLVRFDGLRFKVFNRVNTPAIKGTNFASFGLTVDRDGALWAPTWQSGVIRYANGRFTSFTSRNGLPGNSVVRVDQDETGRIWIFTNPGVSTWSSGKITRVAPAPGCDLNSFLKAPVNLGIDPYLLGLWRFNRASSIWQRFAYGHWSNVPMPADIAHPEIVQLGSLMEDTSRRLWFVIVGRPGEVFCVDGGILLTYRGLPPGTFACYRDRFGRIWTSNSDGRLGLWKDGTFAPLEGLSTSSPFLVFEDRDGEFWVGTLDRGLFRLTRKSVIMEDVPGTPGANNIGTVFEDRNGDLWAGSYGLHRRRNQAWTTYLRRRTPTAWIGNQIVSSFYPEENGDIWVSFPDELTLFHNGHFQSAPSPLNTVEGELNQILRDRHGYLWLGGDGLYRFDGSHLFRYTAADGAATQGVRILLPDPSRDALWIGSDDGLSLYSNGRFQTWHESDGLSSNHILALHLDSEGALWVGTADAGLNRFFHGSFQRLTSLQGLAFDDVSRIFEDRAGYFWLTSRRGISRVLKQELISVASGRAPAISALALGRPDGLATVDARGHGQPRGFIRGNGTLLIPTAAGIAMLTPRDIPVDRRTPPVLIEECRVDRKPIPCGRELRIGPRSSDLEIGYTALNFIHAAQTRFKYQLVGLDRSWVDAGVVRSASYSHLPSGRYTFRVIAANSDGVWNMAGSHLDVVVLPPFYRTWWFLSLAIAALLAAAWLSHRHRLNLVEQKRAAQESFARQLLSTQETERRRIATELHDSLGQRLAMIRNWALLGGARLEGRESPDTELSEISSLAGSALAEVREISYNLGPFHLDQVGAAKAIRAMARRVEQAFRISLDLDIDDIAGALSRDSETNLFRICQEALNNVAKHSGATRASLSLHRLDNHVQLTVCDNGNGFDTSAAREGFGLTGISERVRLLGGSLAVQSAPGEGTTVEVSLPAARLLSTSTPPAM